MLTNLPRLKGRQPSAEYSNDAFFREFCVPVIVTCAFAIVTPAHNAACRALLSFILKIIAEGLDLTAMFLSNRCGNGNRAARYSTVDLATSVILFFIKRPPRGGLSRLAKERG